MRRILSLICGVFFFGATLYSICKVVTPGTVMSFISGSAFLLGTLMDNRDIFLHVEAKQKS